MGQLDREALFTEHPPKSCIPATLYYDDIRIQRGTGPRPTGKEWPLSQNPETGPLSQSFKDTAT